MGKLVVSLDGVVIGRSRSPSDKTTLGRRPVQRHRDRQPAVSGEHAVLQMVGADVFIEDLNSTNGTYINGKAIKKQLLSHNDTVEIGKYKIKYLVDDGTDYEKTMIMKRPARTAAGARRLPADAPASAPPAGRWAPAAVQLASIKVLNGAAAGREVAHQGGHHRRQARRAGGLDHQAPGRLRARPRRRRPAPDGQRQPVTGETVQLKNGDVVGWPARRCSSCRSDPGSRATPRA